MADLLKAHLKLIVKNKGGCGHLLDCKQCPIHTILRGRGCGQSLCYDIAKELLSKDGLCISIW